MGKQCLGPILLPEPPPPTKGGLFHCLFVRCQTHSPKSLLPGHLISGSGPVCGLSSASLPPAPLSLPLCSLSHFLPPEQRKQFLVVFGDKHFPINLVLILSYHQRHSGGYPMWVTVWIKKLFLLMSEKHHIFHLHRSCVIDSE